MDNLSNIPPELKELKQWVIWKADKNPYNPRNNQRAKTNDPRTWDSFDNACKAAKEYRAKGVGFVFAENDPYVGIDLDKVIDDNGDIDYEAQATIDKLDSYSEVSQSGRGVHVIVRGEKPSSRCRKGNVEIYDRSRFFAITGNLWQGRATIEDRQAELDWLCRETFGEKEETEAAPVDDLMLDRRATPPTDKLDVLIGNRDFARTWKHKREDLKSMSEYDMSLAGFAFRAGWSDQEIANLIIAFRRQHGTDEDQEKSLRLDYIKMTLAKVKGNAGALELLPYNEVKLLRFGTEDSEYELWCDGKGIWVGSAEVLLSPKKMEAKFYDNDIVLPPKVWKQWKNITAALLSSVETIETVTRKDSAIAWLDDYISRRMSIPHVETEDDLKRLFGRGMHSIASNNEGRLYLRLCDIARYVRVHTGAGNINIKTVAHDLANLGFRKRKIHIGEEGRDRQIRIWESKPGFMDEGE